MKTLIGSPCRRAAYVVILVLLSICTICVLLFYKPTGNAGLDINEFRTLFRVTQYLNYQIDLDDVNEVRIIGAITIPSADKSDITYSDKQKIQKVLDYLNDIPLAEASKEELPNMSADVFITFYNSDEDVLGELLIYGQVFIEDHASKKLYRIKHSKNNIIDGLENLTFD